MRNFQELREYDNIENTYTEMEHGPVHNTEEVEKKINKNVTIVITKSRQDKKLMMKKYIPMLQLIQKRTSRAYCY